MMTIIKEQVNLEAQPLSRFTGQHETIHVACSVKLVEDRRFELLTPAVQKQCSPS